MALRKSTRRWTVFFGISLAAAIFLSLPRFNDAGCLRAAAVSLACMSGLVLVFRMVLAAFRAIVRRLTLRLAFSYFLIGIVPIPLLAALLFAGAYLVAHQVVATRVKQDIAEEGRDLARTPGPETRDGFEIDDEGRVTTSSVDWLPPGAPAPWARGLSEPRSLIARDHAWLAAPLPEGGGRRFLLVDMTPADGRFERRIGERTGYLVRIRLASERRGSPFTISRRSKDKAARGRTPTPAPSGESDSEAEAQPAASGPAAGNAPSGWLNVRWVAGVYIDAPAAILEPADTGHNVVLYLGRTTPRVLLDQLFAQGVPEVGRVFWGVFTFISASLLVVYLVALAIAFTLVGSLARNVNRLIAASQAVARGDFSVRVNSRSRDQIGDLARSFDGMADSIQKLLLDTARKERLEAEIAIARTIQQKLLPPAAQELPGLSVLAHFEPLAEIGGDYYDYTVAPDGGTVVAVGDVSGHGLSTGLLVAMAKAGLMTLIESGMSGTALFVKLNELIHRSTDSRNYMTLATLAFDASTRTGVLTNAGQLAPYRLSSGTVETLALPSFPLGVSPRSDFPTRAWTLAPGDRVIFLTDGLIEATDAAGDPFGFERLEALLAKQANSPAERLLETILAAVRSHSGGTALEDDRTLLIITIS